jgi:hypothetical protein
VQTKLASSNSRSNNLLTEEWHSFLHQFHFNSIKRENIHNMKKIFLSITAFLVAQAGLFAQGVQATLANGATPSQIMIRLKNASGVAVGAGPLSSFTVGIRIPAQAINPSLHLTGQSGTTVNASSTPISTPVVANGFAYYLVAVNYSGQTFPMAVNQEKDILALSFYSNGGGSAIIPSVEMVDFSDGGPSTGGPSGGQLEYYFAVGATDLTDAGVSFYSLAGVSTGLDNAGEPKKVGIASIPLSVTWIDFVASKSGTDAILDWSTASEKNNVGFEVERSADGKNFSKIGFVNTQATEGNSNEKLAYRFTDNAPLNGDNHYRLKQTDRDGKSSYSKVSRVTFGGGTTSAQVYPNPANAGSVRVQGANIRNIAVFNISGQQVQVPVTYGVSENELNISGLASGNYTIRVNTGAAVTNHKLVIQH